MMLTLDNLSPEERMARERVVTTAYARSNGVTPPDGFRPNGGPRKPSKKQPLASFDAGGLDDMAFPAIKFVVPGYIAEGLTILAGAPKLGKSWLVLEAALAVATGGTCLGGVRCPQGDVLYLALEDNKRRLQSRLRKLWQLEKAAGIGMPRNLIMATECAPANEGGVDQIREWIDEHPAARLVIVDVLARFKSVGKSKDQTHYEADYMAVKELQALASETGVAIVVVHHTRKSAAEVDPFEKVSGTMGLSGAADTVLILDRDGNGCTLYGRGRDIQEIETAVSFDRETCKWRALGEAAKVRLSEGRSVILDLLDDNREPMTPAEIASALGRDRNNIKQTLGQMAKAGQLEKVGKKGHYCHPDHAGYREKHANPDNRDYRDYRSDENRSDNNEDADAIGANESLIDNQGDYRSDNQDDYRKQAMNGATNAYKALKTGEREP